MLSIKARFALASFVSLGVIVAAGAANAKGCNGVVNQLEWGCAAWDNNNGPQFPHYKAPAAPARAAAVPATSLPPSSLLSGARPAAGVINGTGSGVISRDGAGVISRDGAGVISRDGAGFKPK